MSQMQNGADLKYRGKEREYIRFCFTLPPCVFHQRPIHVQKHKFSKNSRSVSCVAPDGAVCALCTVCILGGPVYGCGDTVRILQYLIVEPLAYLTFLQTFLIIEEEHIVCQLRGGGW